MAAATTSGGAPTALIQQRIGASVLAAYPNVGGFGAGPLNLDLLQIVNEGGSILLNVDKTGKVNNPAVAATTAAGGVGQAVVGQFQVSLTGSPTTAALFAAAFSNPSSLDIIQVINIGGNVSYWLDSLGVAHGS